MCWIILAGETDFTDDGRKDLTRSRKDLQIIEEENAVYTLNYLKSLEGKKREFKVGSRTVWHDRTCRQWRLTVQLEETRYWFLSVFIREDGTFSKFSLDYEAASDSHYEFENEAAIRDFVYRPGDEKLLLDEILIRYCAEFGGNAVLSLISPYVTAQFHYD